MLKILTKQTSSKKSWSRKAPKLNEDGSDRKPISAFENILFHLNALKQSQEMFDQFMDVVEEDIRKKKTLLKSVGLNDQLSTNQKTYASVQSFMLKRYSNRIKSFHRASENSIANICEEYCKDARDDKNVANLVNKHIDALVKMKRRMKHIIDVSEKYAVIDLFTTINILSDESYDLDPSSSLKDSKDRRLNKSVTSFHNHFDSPSFSRSPSPSSVCSLDFKDSKVSDFECLPIKFGKQPLRPFKSLSDHIFVLTKTYTNKQ